jgi:hypothetical protein
MMHLRMNTHRTTLDVNFVHDGRLDVKGGKELCQRAEPYLRHAKMVPELRGVNR